MNSIRIGKSLFEALEKGDTSRILELLGESFVVNDPAVGEIYGDRARQYICLVATTNSLKINFNFLDADPFFCSVKWSLQMTLKNKMVINPKGLAIMQIEGNKISKLSNTYNLTLLLGSITGFSGYFLGPFPFYKKNFKERLIKQLDRYISKDAAYLQKACIKADGNNNP